MNVRHKVRQRIDIYHMTERSATPEKRTRVSKPKTQKRKKRNQSRQNPNRCHIRCSHQAILFPIFPTHSESFGKFYSAFGRLYLFIHDFRLEMSFLPKLPKMTFLAENHKKGVPAGDWSEKLSETSWMFLKVEWIIILREYRSCHNYTVTYSDGTQRHTWKRNRL